MVAFAIDPTLKEASFAFPYLAITVLPAAVGVVVVVAGLSATMSSASSDAIAAVTILLRDLSAPFERRLNITSNMMRSSRVGLLLIIVLALFLALLSNDIIGYITSMIATLMSGLFVCGLLGKYWPRFNRYGALASLLAGSLTSLLVITSDALTRAFGNPILPSVAAALVVGILVALLTPASRVSMQEAQAILERQRNAVEMA